MEKILDIVPVPKPRMTRKDKWAERPSVLRYRAFADELRLKLDRDWDFNHCDIEFVIPMPPSWSKKQKALLDGMPHTQTPDIDNLQKALFDAHMAQDCGIHCLHKVRKRWGRTGSIVLNVSECDPLPF